ncbi:MAG: hypothetical protein JNK76_09145 [Planctomycetales bacterium]|nr:hypothetical protein [Planctomycetales bacterium]
MQKMTPFESGKHQALIDINAGRPRLFSGAPSRPRWATDYAASVREEVDVEVVFVSDITNQAECEFRDGYNKTIESYVDNIHGAGSLNRLWEIAQQRRLESHRAHFVAIMRPSDESPQSGAN